MHVAIGNPSSQWFSTINFVSNRFEVVVIRSAKERKKREKIIIKALHREQPINFNLFLSESHKTTTILLMTVVRPISL